MKTRSRRLAMGLLVGGLVWLLGGLALGQAEPPAKTAPLDLNPATGCMEALFAEDQPRATRQVPAAAVLESLRGGHCLRLRHAIVQGDLDLTQLPVNGVTARGGDLIRIAGAFVVRDSTVSGAFIAGGSADDPRVRFEGPVVFSGSALGEVNLGGAQFAEGVDLGGVAVGGELQATGARFGRDLELGGAQFQGAVVLERARVEGRWTATEATFQGELRAAGLAVRGAVLLRQARFQGAVDLSRGRFERQADLDQAQFDAPARLVGTAFGGEARFEQAHFGDVALFGGALFAQGVTFDGASFSQGAQFERGRFLGQARFAGAAFGGEARFGQALFGGWVDFAGTSFQELDLKRAAFLAPSGPRWRGAVFAGPVHLEGTYSAGPWQLQPGQLESFPPPDGYPFLPHEQPFDPTPWLLGATAAGLGLLLLLTLLG